MNKFFMVSSIYLKKNTKSIVNGISGIAGKYKEMDKESIRLEPAYWTTINWF